MGETRRADIPSDGDLARRVSAAGADAADAEAELFRRLAPRVRLYGLRHLRDPAEADRILRELVLDNLTCSEGEAVLILLWMSCFLLIDFTGTRPPSLPT